MPDWAISFLIGIALTFVLMGVLALLGRLEEKKIREQREEERRRRRSFDWENNT